MVGACSPGGTRHRDTLLHDTKYQRLFFGTGFFVSVRQAVTLHSETIIEFDIIFNLIFCIAVNPTSVGVKGQSVLLC